MKRQRKDGRRERVRRRLRRDLARRDRHWRQCRHHRLHHAMGAVVVMVQRRRTRLGRIRRRRLLVRGRQRSIDMRSFESRHADERTAIWLCLPVAGSPGHRQHSADAGIGDQQQAEQQRQRSGQGFHGIACDNRRECCSRRRRRPDQCQDMAASRLLLAVYHRSPSTRGVASRLSVGFAVGRL